MIKIELLFSNEASYAVRAEIETFLDFVADKMTGTVAAGPTATTALSYVVLRTLLQKVRGHIAMLEAPVNVDTRHDTPTVRQSRRVR